MREQLGSSYRNPSPSGLDRFIKGFGSTVIGQFITAISAIVMVPLFINAWGSIVYGRWLTLFAIVSYLTLMDLGGQSYIGNLLAQAHAQNDPNRFREILSQGVSFYFLISICAWSILVMILFIPFTYLPCESNLINFQERMVLFALGTNNLLSIPAGVFVTSYRASGQLARGTMIGNIIRFISLGIFIFILSAHVSPTIYAITNLCVGIFLTIVLLYDSRKKIPESNPIKISWQYMRGGIVYLKGAILFWILSLSSLINSQGIILVLGTGMTATAVAIYSTQRTAAGLLGHIGGLIQAPLWPELTFFHSQNRGEDLSRVSLLSIKLIVALTGMAALGLYIFLPIIYPLWTGHQMIYNPVLFSVFLIQGVLAAGWITSSWPLLASNQHKQLSLWSLLNAIVTILLALFLINRWGLVGVAIATLSGDILCGLLIYPSLAAKGLGLPTITIYYAIFRPILVLVICLALILCVNLLMREWLNITDLVLFILLAGPVFYLSIGKRDMIWLYRVITKFKRPFLSSNES